MGAEAACKSPDPVPSPTIGTNPSTAGMGGMAATHSDSESERRRSVHLRAPLLLLETVQTMSFVAAVAKGAAPILLVPPRAPAQAHPEPL